jgi:hypothetical protein
MHTVPRGSFDRRTLDQPWSWVNRDGQILELMQLSRKHPVDVLAMLPGMASRLHLEAMADLFGATRWPWRSRSSPTS